MISDTEIHQLGFAVRMVLQYVLNKAAARNMQISFFVYNYEY